MSQATDLTLSTLIFTPVTSKNGITFFTNRDSLGIPALNKSLTLSTLEPEARASAAKGKKQPPANGLTATRPVLYNKVLARITFPHTAPVAEGQPASHVIEFSDFVGVDVRTGTYSTLADRQLLLATLRAFVLTTEFGESVLNQAHFNA